MDDRFYKNYFLTQMLEPNENILWHSEPDKKCFIFEAIFNSMLPFALIWFLFDAFFLFLVFSTPEQNFNGGSAGRQSTLTFIIIFFAFHLMPVWIYLGGVISAVLRHKYTEYVITDKAIYLAEGSSTCERREYKDLDKTNLRMRQGFFDKILNTGDVILEQRTEGYGRGRRTIEYAIEDVPDFLEVYGLIKDLISKAQNSRNEEM